MSANPLAAGSDVNPLKTDPDLQALLKRLDGVKKYKTFQRWKNKFLDRLEQFLYEKGMKPADKACNEFDALLKGFVKRTNKVQEHIEKGDLGESKKTVKAALSLNEMCSSLQGIVEAIDKVIPMKSSEEKKRGFSKFHLGATLIRQGFHQYVTMKAIEDALTDIGDKLVDVADRQQHELFAEYRKSVQKFCDVMADLNLYEVMLKCIEFLEAPEEEESSDEEPVTIKITIDTHDGKKITLVLDPTDTVGNVKAAIADGCGIKPNKQILKFLGKALDNPDATLESCGITDDSNLTVEPFKVPVTVNTMDGKSIKVMVDPSDRLSDIKIQLEEESGIPAKNQTLFMGGEELKDPNKTAADYGIKAGSVLDLEPKTMNISVKTPDGKTIKVAVKPSDTAEEIKAKIAAEAGMKVAQQVLKHGGKEMKDGTTVRDMGITDGSELTVDIHKVPVTVNTMDGKSIKVMIDPTDRLSDIKVQLEEESGVPAKNQKLSMGGKELTDPNKTAGDYGIKAGSVLDLEPKVIKINVKTPDGKTISVEVNANDTAEQVKAKIAKDAGMSVAQQILKHNGKEFADGKTVKDMGIKDGSDLTVDIFKVPVTVNTMDGKSIKVMIDPTDRLSDIKVQLEEETGLPAKNQKLSMNGEELTDPNKTAKDYGIKKGSVLDLEPKVIKINVKTPDGKTISVEVNANDTAEQVKAKIAKDAGMSVAQQLLKHNGKEFADGKTVKDMGIKEGSDLTVEIFKVPVTVNTADGKSIKVMIDPTDKLSDIKVQLEDETGVAAKNQRLSMNGQELTDPNKTAKDYGIKKGSVLDLEPKVIKVMVEMPDGKKQEVELSSSDTDAEIKAKIAKKTGMAAPRQVLKVNGKELPKGKTVGQMGIKDGSDLKVDIFKLPITVKTPDGKTIKLGVEPGDSVDKIKKLIAEETGMEPKKQLLKLNDEEIKGSKTAKDLGIQAGTELVLEEQEDPIIFVDCKSGTLFAMDRDDVIKKEALKPHQNNKLDFLEAAKDSATKDRIAQAMKASPKLGVSAQVVVTALEVQEYDLEEAEKVKGVFGVSLKKREKNKAGEEFLFVDPKTGASGELSRKKYIDMKFITPDGDTIKEREKDTMQYDKYILLVRQVIGVKEFK
ncbi:Polyubiquitin (Fragment) [Seminavis robusta]|uniref:Polyubiquitin n=1 Tax=Seminavis robusta TaxID=568900 RepID=A0A9N8HLJ4_9STRA